MVVATIAKQPHLGVVALFLNPLAIFKRTFDGCHQLGSFGSGHIEGAAFNQALNNPFVYLFQINPFAKIEERFKAFFPAAGDNGFDGAFTDIFDGHQPEADLGPVHRECYLTFIYIRRQNGYVVITTFGNKFDHTICGMHFTGQQSGHKFHRIMRFKIGGLVSNQGIGGAV